MRQQWTALILSGALICAMSVPALAAAPVESASPPAPEETDSLPDSILYYGAVEEIGRDENGAVTRLSLTSESSGEFVMNLSGETVWIDSGNHTRDDPSDLEAGEYLYVFHSPVATLSIPPQSTALAVVRHVPMDAGCARYHQVEAVSRKEGQMTITTDNGGLLLLADGETVLSRYDGGEVSPEDIQTGGRVMAWYAAVAQSCPGQAHPSHLMLLPAAAGETAAAETEEPLTRGELVSMLHEEAGSPVVNYAMRYTDVKEGDPCAEAIRWATSEHLVGGYGNGEFGADRPITRQQLAVILYRYARTQGQGFVGAWAFPLRYSDADKIGGYAYEAMCWMVMNGILGDTGGNALAPQGTITREQAAEILASFLKELKA